MASKYVCSVVVARSRRALLMRSDKPSHWTGARLTIHGRSAKRAELVARYAARQLGPAGWSATSTTSMEAALDGADIVIHQIRYGDLAGRAAGEELCRTLKLPADETLGPAALLTAIHSMRGVKGTSATLSAHCADAKVLNLTNPLSAVTHAMQHYGVRNCVGLCELPLVTVRTAARQLGIAAEDTSWTYCGLNHRGFVDSLTYGERDMLDELPDRLGDGTLGGVRAGEIAELGALPLKYFRLMRDSPTLEFGRATQLEELRSQIQRELECSIDLSPPSLGKRYMAWYPQSVVPLVQALVEDAPSSHVVNVPRDDGLVVETKVAVSTKGVEPDFHETTNPQVATWNSRFEAHELAFIEAMFDPTLRNIEAAMELDPVVPAYRTAEAANLLLKTFADSFSRSSV